MTHLAAELIAHAVEKITGSMAVDDEVVLLRALDATEHDGGVVRCFSPWLREGGSEEQAETGAE
jgi:hypothetical protein